MTLPEISIRRPVFATVLSLVITLLGVISYQRLTVREYPNIDEPVVNVTTTYRGASAEIIESQVTIPLEESLAGIEGVDVMTSSSRPERSQITVRFRIDRNIESTAADVRDRVGRVRGRLPDEIDEPIIAKVEADAQPVIYLAFSSSNHTPLEISDYADRFVKDRLQTLPGVAEVRILGERRYSMRIWLDRVRLAAYGMTPQDVEDALRRQNVEVPAGRIESAAREFTVLAETDLRTPEQFDNIILRDQGGYFIRLKDVGRAEVGAQDNRVIARFNGNPSVTLGIVKQSIANPLDISKMVRAELPRIEAELPAGMRVNVSYDTSIFIERSIENVFHTIFEAIVLVVIVIFVFLRSLRATIIPLVTIPVSLIGTFAFMLAMGFTVNTLTLLAMVLAIGLVVDDAIVMLENISRHVEAGLSPFKAALKGSREIAFAVIAMTITLVAVYAPIAFQTGRTGRLFIEFALTLACAVLVSGFVALTLSPMMCSKLLKHQERHGKAYVWIEQGLEWLNRSYRQALLVALRVRPVVLSVMLAVAAAGWVIFRMLPAELSPIEDRGTVFMVGIAPEGSTIDYVSSYAREIEQVLKDVPNVEGYFTIVGFPIVTRVIAYSRLTDWSERDIKQQQIVSDIRPKMAAIPGLLSFPSNPPSLGRSALDKPVQFVLQTSAPYEELQKALDVVMAAARKNPGLLNLDTDLQMNKPELRVTVDREKAANLGVPVETIGRTLETMLGGRQVTRYKQNGKQYDVIVQVEDAERTTPENMRSIFVRAASGQMVPLSNLVRIEDSVTARELNHFNKLRSATITANLAPGYSLGEALAFLEAEAARLPSTISNDLGGESREFRTSSGDFYLTLVLAALFIFLVLAAQFESFVDPLIIMLTVPLSMTGALLALWLSGGTMNVYSQIGLVTLVGLITKHGILIVEFANQLQDAGRSRREAVIESAVLRLRPILMTTGAMVLGSVPLALASGAGAESRHQIGWVIVGGLLLGTLLTLFVVPTAYTLLARDRSKMAALHEKEAEASPHPAE